MESHLSSDAGVLLALVPWLPCAVREPGPAVCPASWPACALWPGAVGLWGCALSCSLVCGPAMPALWAGLVRGPGAWASYKPLPYGPILRPCIPGLIWASEKGFIFARIFSAMYFRDFSGLYFRLKISGQIFRASKSGFFSPDFCGENFPDIFSGFYFPAFFRA
uniref:Uncharacterized protein n=1 Tax=Caudovirales sp. ctIsq18 TaxID=2825762 RepID=A0A8S5PKY2_9CAUD|nr:MAG TPA: hypothetical protein [Caudovirales sp. ctIsq18]